MTGLKISNVEYRRREGVSSTDLKHMVKSPQHFRYWKDNVQESTQALVFGRAAHKYVLEREEFAEEFAIEPLIDRRTKEGKAKWLLFQDENEDKDIISAEDFQKIQEMREALYSTPFVEQLLSGEKEMSFFMEDEKTGVLIKCRPDALIQIGDAHIIVDYKTTTDASSDAFMRNAISLNYDLQMAMYKEIMDKNTGYNHAVIFIVQEKTPPYAVNILEANEYFLKSGYDMFRTYLNLYKECLDSGNWYGLVNGEINSLGLPNWLQKQYEVL